MLEYRKMITRDMLRKEPNALFVFGDNLDRSGLGGQAKEMRGEPNSVGIPTKKHPRMNEDAFFTNGDFTVWLNAASKDITRLVNHRGLIVWPTDGIGTGLAQLETRAPDIWVMIDIVKNYLDSNNGS